MKIHQVMYKVVDTGIAFGVVVTINADNVTVQLANGETVIWAKGQAHKVRDYKLAADVRKLFGFEPVTITAVLGQPESVTITPHATVEELASGDWTPNADGTDPTDEDEEHL